MRPACGTARYLPVTRDSMVHTFSICAVDSVRRIVGAATASRYIAVGSLVPHLEVGAGVVLTQSIANPLFGPRGLLLLRAGTAPDAVIESLLEHDEKRELRQIAVLSHAGAHATHTGGDCISETSEYAEKGVVALGNTLVSDQTAQVMVRAYRESLEGFPQPEAHRTVRTESETRASCNRIARALIAALQAGEAAGGDSRGKQAAALLVKGPNAGYSGNGDVAVDLRVDDHADPVNELSRIFDLFLETQEKDSE